MKKISTKELIPGMKIAEDVYTYNDQLILSKGIVLSDKAIIRLEFYSILSVKVEDEIVINTPAPDTGISYSQKIKTSPAYKEFKHNFEHNVSHFKSVLDDIAKNGKPLNQTALLDNMLTLLDTSQGPINVFDMLHNMRHYDDLTYAHSINVALICNVFSKWLHFSEEDIRLATLCGLLHDIGKIMIPDVIIKKPGKLSDEEFATIKKHTLEGYQILRNQNVSDSVKNAALMHHERCDGTGYPLALEGDKIDNFAKIVAIADVYDAMTSARVYRGPLCPFKVISLFEAEGIQKYDAKYVLTFLESVVSTYLQNRVVLTNGVEGDIVFINKNMLSKPVIKSGSDYIDLSTNPDLQIQDFV